jgi:hypothetical protein
MEARADLIYGKTFQSVALIFSDKLAFENELVDRRQLLTGPHKAMQLEGSANTRQFQLQYPKSKGYE